MLVKAKWTVKDASGWHNAGAVFDTESDLGDAVVVLNAPKKPAAQPEARKPEPEKAAETEPAKEPAKAPRSASRRKKG